MNLKKILFGNILINSTAVNVGLVLLRIFTGLALAFGHGFKKLPPTDKFIEGAANMNFPLPVLFAWLSVTTEFLGGIFLALGLFTRPVAFFIMINMLVAAFITPGAKTFGKVELALFYEFIALAFLFIGSGKYGIDHILYGKKS